MCGHAPALNLHNHLGEPILVQPLPEHEYGSQAYNGHRGEMHQVLFEYALAIGIDIRLGQNVTDCWENEDSGKSGVVTNGEILQCDVLVGADGVRSKIRRLAFVSNSTTLLFLDYSQSTFTGVRRSTETLGICDIPSLVQRTRARH